jgi:hypothetical protein
MFITPYLGRLVWISECELELISKDKENKFSVNVAASK